MTKCWSVKISGSIWNMLDDCCDDTTESLAGIIRFRSNRSWWVASIVEHPERKMSKSEPSGCLFLDDTPDTIRTKIRKATPIGEGYENLVFLFNEFVGEPIPEQNSQLKEKLAEAIIYRLELK